MMLNDTDRNSWICQICIDMSYVVSAQKSWTDTPGAYSLSPIFLLTPPKTVPGTSRAGGDGGSVGDPERPGYSGT